MVDKKIRMTVFAVGIIIALILSFVGSAMLALISLVFGIAAGFTNIEMRERTDFLVAVIAMTVLPAAALATIPAIGLVLSSLLANVAAFFFGMAVPVAIMQAYDKGMS